MRGFKKFVAFLLSAAAAPAGGAACSATVYDLRANGVPCGGGACYVDSATPALSWALAFSPLPLRPAAQAAFRVVAASSAAALAAGRYDLYDGGLVNSSATVGAARYGGAGLERDGAAAFFTVIVVDAAGALCVPPPTAFGVAVRAPADAAAFAANGGAAWIAATNALPADECASYLEAPAPLLRRDFSLPAGAAVAAAHLFVTGLGLYTAHINGIRVGDLVFDPAWTTVERRVQYSAFDVTALLHAGGAENAIGIELGRGWFDPLPMRLFGAFNLRDALTVGPPRALAYLLVLFADGSRFTLGTDASWRAGSGELRRDNIYIGVQSDLREAAAVAGWASPGFDDAAWPHAVLATTSSPLPLGPLQLRRAPGVRVTAEYAPTSVAQSSAKPGSWTVSFPRNMAGVVRVLNVSGAAAGEVTRLTFAEILDGAGEINTRTNLAGCIGCWDGPDWGPCAPVPALETDNVTWAGVSAETFEPRYTWHAFQHVRIDGWPAGAPPPTAANFLARQLHVDNDGSDSSFASWDPQHAQIDALAEQSFRSNWAGGLQSDCPGRERLGYGGDLLAAADGAMMLFDLRVFYAKRVYDYGDAARPNGGLPETAPFMGIASCDLIGNGTGPSSWGAAHVTLALQLFARYGDRELVIDTFSGTVRPWLRLLNASAAYALHAGGPPTATLTSGLPDVLGSVADCDGACDCPLMTLMGTVFLVQQAAAAARAGAIAGAGADKVAALEAVAAAGRFVNLFFHNDTGVVGVGGIDETLWALWAGAVPEEARPRVWATVAAALRANGTHLHSGALATGMLFALGPDGGAAADLNDVLLECLQQRDFPSYGFMLAKGATSLFEHWDTATNPSSWNHAWLGSVSAYFRRQLAGLSLDEQASAGYDHIVIRPHPPTFGSAAARVAGGGNGTLPWANATVGTVRGPVGVQWRYEYSPGTGSVTMRLFVQLPGSAAADVFLPRPLGGAAVTARGACAEAGAPTASSDARYDAYDLSSFAGECEFFASSSLGGS